MSFSQANGYVPVPIPVLMDALRIKVNLEFGTTYTDVGFVGTGWYKYAYAALQKVAENETKTAEIFQKLQEYISSTNERIRRPSVSLPGIVEQFQDAGFVAAVKPPNNADAGKIFIALNLLGTETVPIPYATLKLTVNTLIKDYIAGGLVSQGAQVNAIVLSNGQSFDFKFDLAARIPILLRMTAVRSENSLTATPTDPIIRQKIFDNTSLRYRLGLNFEPQAYYGHRDAPWAGSILLEYSTDGGITWLSTVFDSLYNQLYTFALGDISLVIT